MSTYNRIWKVLGLNCLLPLLIAFLFCRSMGPVSTQLLSEEAACLAGLGLLIIIVLHFIVNMDPAERFVSEYARDRRFGFLMDWAFLWLGVASGLLGWSFHLADTIVLPWMLGIAGACLAADSIAVSDSSVRGKSATRSEKGDALGQVHGAVTAVAFIIFIFAMAAFPFFWNDNLPNSVSWLRGVSLAYFGATLMFGLAYAVALAKKGFLIDSIGLIERILILAFFEWVAIACYVQFFWR